MLEIGQDRNVAALTTSNYACLFWRIMIEDRMIELQQKAVNDGEVPVVALLVDKEKILYSVYNKVEMHKKIQMHAEFLLVDILQSVESFKNFYKYDVYVTMEPCLMCYGLLTSTNLKKVYYYLKNDKTGFSKFIKEEKIDKRFIYLIGARNHNKALSVFFKEMRK